MKQLEKIKTPNVFILCESFPKNRYVYDLQTAYNDDGIRFNLKSELYGSNCSDVDFISNLQTDKLLIVDCAFCPIHDKILTNKERRHSSTLCLQRHNINILNKFPDVPIITIFPLHRGFLKTQLPEIATRIKAEFEFRNLSGLKAQLEKLLNVN